MKVGILANVLCNLTLEEALGHFAQMGIEAVEIGCGGTPGAQHCDPDVLLHDEAAFARFKGLIERSGLEISAFSCHGNPVHPTKSIAKRYDAILRNGILMAERMDVNTVCCFSGCPGDWEGAIYPNWVTSVWPFDFVEILKYQWDEVLIPYWREMAAFARAHGVTKIAIEMHPGFAVYNPETLLRLREACGEEIGANFDPSHLIWQGIDCPAAIRNLGGAIHHFHAKDTEVHEQLMAANGFFAPDGNIDSEGPFNFRIPPNGSGPEHWRKMITALILAGYDGVLSIEHEDNTRGQMEGISESAKFLSQILAKEARRGCWWKAPIRAYQRTFLPVRGEEGGDGE